MKISRGIVYCLTVVLIAAVFFLGMLEETPEPEIPFSFAYEQDGSREEILCWSDGAQYYVFLPGYVDIENLQLVLSPGAEVFLGETEITAAFEKQKPVTERAYPLHFSTSEGSVSGTLSFVQSQNLASLHIDTPSGSMDHIHAQKGNTETGRLRLYRADGTLNYSGQLDSIGGRGNSSWKFAKKPYSLTLSTEADLLGMGTAQRWVLLANATDVSHLRNKLAFDLAEEMGLSYTAESEWVDLYLNGEYAGVYLLCERNEVHSQRVAVEQPGSFLVSQEMESRLIESNAPYMTTDSGQSLRIHYADQKDAAARLWKSAENAMRSEAGIDPETGRTWQELIDVDSWVRKYLLEELVANVDAGYLSQYFYADGSGRIHAGPVWDYDYAMGNQTLTNTQQAEAFFADKLYVKQDVLSPWYYSLCRKEAFQEQITQIYTTVCKPALERVLHDHRERYTSLLTQAARADAIRWGIEPDAFAEESRYILDYMTRRAAFLDSVWIEKAEYCIVRIDDGNDSLYAYHAVKPGETLQNLPEIKNNRYYRFHGWYQEETDEPFDPAQPIYEDLQIYQKRSNTRLYTLVQAGPYAAIAGVFVLLLLAEGIQTKRNGYRKHDRKKRAKISP